MIRATFNINIIIIKTKICNTSFNETNITFTIIVSLVSQI